MQRVKLSRRAFLKKTSACAAGSFMMPYVITSTALGTPTMPPASERVTVGHIGVGNQGSGATQVRREILVVCLHRAQGAVLHVVHRPSGDRAASLALADVAAKNRRNSGLAIQLLYKSHCVSQFRASAESLRRSYWLADRLQYARGRQEAVGQRGRPVHLSARSRRRCTSFGACSRRAG